MAKFSYGEHIKTIPDVQNLVVSIIFRIEDTYTQNDLVIKVQEYLKGSNLKLSEKKLTEIIQDTLFVCQNYDLVVCSKGLYRTISGERIVITKTDFVFSNEEKLNLGI